MISADSNQTNNTAALWATVDIIKILESYPKLCELIGAAEKTQVFEGGPYHYRASVPIPPDGRWRAFLLEIYYPGPEGPTTRTKTFKFTTQVQIVPFSFPFKNCTTKDQCHGSLV